MRHTRFVIWQTARMRAKLAIAQRMQRKRIEERTIESYKHSTTQDWTTTRTNTEYL